MLGEDDLKAFPARNLHPVNREDGESPSLLNSILITHTDKAELEAPDPLARTRSIDLIHWHGPDR